MTPARLASGADKWASSTALGERAMTAGNDGLTSGLDIGTSGAKGLLIDPSRRSSDWNNRRPT